MKEKGSPDRSFPWCDEDYLQLGEYKLVYTTDAYKRIISVKVPGGGAINVHRLLNSSDDVKYPKKLRLNREHSYELLQEHFNLSMGY